MFQQMTGLQVLTDKIMEIAVLITDGELNIVAEGPNIVIHQDDDTLDNMNTWCVNQHGKVMITYVGIENNAIQNTFLKQKYIIGPMYRPTVYSLLFYGAINEG
jgi:oligoribonuclease (3'-5' exoribonuclease)